MNLTELFRITVSLSLLGSILAIGILLIKLLFRRKLSANWHYCIWFVLLFRLLMPFTPSAPFSVFNFVPHRQMIDVPQITLANSQVATSTTAIKTNENSVKTNQNTANVIPATLSDEKVQHPQAASLKSWFNWQTSAHVWILGVITIFFYLTLVNGLLLFKTRKLPVCVSEDVLRILQDCKSNLNVHSKVSIVYDDSLKSPALFGILYPKIIISPEIIKKLSPGELRYVFLHELSHLKRRDLLVNGLILAIQVIYWFNPLIWYALRQMKQDCEMACDATALAALKPEDHRKYGQTIISLLQLLSEPYWAPGTLGFVSKFNTRRIVMISTNKKTTIKWAIAALILTLAVGCSSLSNPINPGNSANQAISSQNQQINTTSGQSKDIPTNSQQNTNPNNPASSSPTKSKSILYKNAQYGFNFSLPVNWQGYSIISGRWDGYDANSNKITQTGPIISIRHPQWTSQNPRQDIPIMVFTVDQWNLLWRGKFNTGAAPVGPSELGRNGSYVFALPARYNYAFPTGYEEVEKILANHPLQATTNPKTPAPKTPTTSPSSPMDSIVYRNIQYGFSFTLPVGWKGYSIINGRWDGYDVNSGKIAKTGPMISIRHPQWTSQEPRQDIPVMVFTLDQWNLLQQGKFHIGAAPIGPSELGRNERYVFALPARYNYAFPTGYEEVEKILENHPLKAI